VDALLCATEIQAGMVERNATKAIEQRVEFRLGINVGDVVAENGASEITTGLMARSRWMLSRASSTRPILAQQAAR
jgi:class 3 adenylate cyclase